jgi:transposase
MTQQPVSTSQVPEATAQMARAIFPEGNLAMAIRDKLYNVYDDYTFTELYPDRGQPALSAWRLALVSILQFAEDLSDRQAAEAVRDRISWKYLLGLELTDTGFDASVLSEFRSRLIQERVEYRLLNKLLSWLQMEGLLKGGGRVRTDATHVLAAVRSLNRLTVVGETLRHALNELASVAPDWLRQQVSADWYERYGRRVEDYRLPKTDPERDALAQRIGEDGLLLLKALDGSAVEPAWREVEAVAILRQVWAQQYDRDAGGHIHWRTTEELPAAAELIQSPFDVEARYAVKRDTSWTGYKVHLTESCDADSPHLITHVYTTLATTPDEQALEAIHANLAVKGLLPAQHITDEGYIGSAQVVASQTQYGVWLLGPMPSNTSWQAQAAQGFAATDFEVDWSTHTLTCPAGQRSVSWTANHDRHGNPLIRVRFSRPTCRACPLRPQCTHSTTGPRSVTLQPQAQQQALQTARQFETTQAFKSQYAARAGIEGTLAQGIHLGGIRRTRYRGLLKTRLQHILMAVAINLIRVIAWLNDLPLATSRRSAFAALALST